MMSRRLWHVKVPMWLFIHLLLFFHDEPQSVQGFAVSSFSSAIVGRKQPRLSPLVVSMSSSEKQQKQEPTTQELEYLKTELTAYLEKRREVGADQVAKETIGKTIGGTKGNKILEYVSGSPNKEIQLQEAPNALDYDELTKYGYGFLVTPIMKAGGRLKMYQLLGMDAPAIALPQPKSAPKLEIDREGKQTRYTGLKLGQVLDDTAQGMALQTVQEKVRRGEKPSVSGVWKEVETFVPPFADKRNTGPKQTPDWTPQKLDEWGKQQGRVEAWARAAAEGAFVQDPLELLDSVTPVQVSFNLVTVFLFALAFGRSTPTLLTWVMGTANDTLLEAVQVPAVALTLASVGSSLYCGYASRQKNRNATVWAVKGLIGGPITVRQLAEAKVLLTQKETDDRAKE